MATERWLIAVAAAALLAWLVQFAFHGPLWTPDTMTYLAMAEALQEGTLRTGLHYRPITEMYPVQTGWPPGYPALLALLLALGVSPTGATTGLACVCFVATTVLAASLLQRLTGRSQAAVVALSLLGFGPFLEIGLRGWSEGPWLVIWLALLHALQSRRSLLIGLFSGLLLLLRHASAPLLPVVLLYVAWSRGSREALKCGLVQGAVAGWWVVFSFGASGRFGYVHPHDDGDLASIAWNIVAALSWSLGGSATQLLTGWPWAGLVLLGLVLVGVRGGRGDRASWWPWILAGGVLQTTAYVYVRWGHYLDEPDDRLLLPLSMPIWLYVWAVIADRTRSLGRLGALLAIWAMLVGAFTHLQGAHYFDWVQMKRYDAAVSWLQTHALEDDLVLHGSAVGIHQRTGLAVVGPFRPPYGTPVTSAELDALTTLWKGRVILMLPDRTREQGKGVLATVSTHPRAVQIGDEAGFSVWWIRAK